MKLSGQIMKAFVTEIRSLFLFRKASLQSGGNSIYFPVVLDGDNKVVKMVKKA